LDSSEKLEIEKERGSKEKEEGGCDLGKRRWVCEDWKKKLRLFLYMLA
jgi:hypothetical protein